MALLSSQEASAQDRVVNPHVTISLIPASTSAVPGERLPVALHFTLEPGWYIYWRNPGQGGIAPRANWQLPRGWSADSLAWPVPERYDVAGVTTHIHRGPVALGTELRIPVSARGRAPIAVDVSYGVCRDVCLPGRATLGVDLPVESAALPNGDWPGVHALLRARAPRSGGPRLTARLRDSTVRLVLRSRDGGPLRPSTWTFFPADPAVAYAAVTGTARPGAGELSLSLPLAACTPQSLQGTLVEGDAREARPSGYAVSVPVRGGVGC
jgi:thiol:disulfide interchange protein DsbD